MISFVQDKIHLPRIKLNFNTQLYLLTKYIVTLLEKQHLSIWADAGTLLGVIRHQGMIPWDIDVDFQCHIKDRDKILQALNNDVNLEVMLCDGYRNYQLTEKPPEKCPTFIKVIRKNGSRATYFDLFPIEPTEHSNVYEINCWGIFWGRDQGKIKTCNNACTRLLDYPDPYPIQQGKFYDLNINIPNNPETILRRYYGSNVLTHDEKGRKILNFRPAFIYPSMIQNLFRSY